MTDTPGVGSSRGRVGGSGRATRPAAAGRSGAACRTSGWLQAGPPWSRSTPATREAKAHPDPPETYEKRRYERETHPDRPEK